MRFYAKNTKVGNSALYGINFANIVSTVCGSEFLTCWREGIITRNCTAVRYVSTVVGNAAGGLIDVQVAPRCEWKIEFSQWKLNQNVTFSFKCTQIITRH